jgi:hypothetical protein
MRTKHGRNSTGHLHTLTAAALAVAGAVTAFPASVPSAMARTTRQSTGSGGKASAAHTATLAITLEEAPFVPGQPVIVTARVTNASGRELSGMEFAYYEYSGGWLRFEVLDDAGKVVRRDTRTTRMDGHDPLPEPPRPDGLTIISGSGSHPSPAALLPGKSKEWRFVLPPAMIPDRPGRYTLVARATLPTGREGSAKSALPELRTPLVIGEYDRGRLRTLAVKHRAAAFGPGNSFSALNLDALMAFPPASVRSIWRGLALDPHLSGPARNTLVSWLVRQGSREARAILREMREREPLGSDLRTGIDHQLKVLAWRAGEKVEW